MLGLVREKMLGKSSYYFCSVSQPREGVRQQPEVCDSCLNLGKDYGRLLVEYEGLVRKYNSLKEKYYSRDEKYIDLCESHNSLQEKYDKLRNGNVEISENTSSNAIEVDKVETSVVEICQAGDSGHKPKTFGQILSNDGSSGSRVKTTCHPEPHLVKEGMTRDTPTHDQDVLFVEKLEGRRITSKQAGDPVNIFGGSSSAMSETCHACGETGHFRRNCPRKVEFRCYRCNQTGHKASECHAGLQINMRKNTTKRRDKK